MKLRCPSPDCRKTFPWEPNQGFPRFCPVCGFDTATPEERTEVIAAPMVASERTKSIDAHARNYMDASDARADQAADLLGVPKAEVSDMRVTDMRDNLREGDIAARPVVNEVTMAMDRINQLRPGSVGFQGAAAQEFAAQAHTGRAPNGTPIRGDRPRAGARAAVDVSGFHRDHSHAMVKSGETGRH